MDLDEIKKRRIEVSGDDLANSEDNLNFLIPAGASVLVVVLVIGVFAFFKKDGNGSVAGLNLDTPNSTASAQASKSTQVPLQGPAVPSKKPSAQGSNTAASNLPSPQISSPSPVASPTPLPSSGSSATPSPSPSPSVSPSPSPSVSPSP